MTQAHLHPELTACRCPACEYDLRAQADSAHGDTVTCPECGLRSERRALDEPDVIAGLRAHRADLMLMALLGLHWSLALSLNGPDGSAAYGPAIMASLLLQPVVIWIIAWRCLWFVTGSVERAIAAAFLSPVIFFVVGVVGLVTLPLAAVALKILA